MPAWPVPDAFARTIAATFGEPGREWLNELPGIIAQIERRWSVRALEPFALSFNYVAPAVRDDGTACVLKLGVPDPELAREAAALELYGGRQAARLLDADPARGALLLERADPGISLWDAADDDAATRAAASLMRALWQPVPEPHPFRSLADWTSGLARLRPALGGTGPFPAPLVDRAERAFAELVGGTPPVLLHADLHHANILRASRAPYLAIDPKGVVGDAGYDVGPFLMNPTPEVASRTDLARLLERRVAVFSQELGLDEPVVAAWGVAHAVLSAWWTLESHGEGWEPAIACASALRPLAR